MLPQCVRRVLLAMCHFRYMLQYQESIPCEQLVMRLCDLKQSYTQFGGACLCEGDRPSAMMKSFSLPFFHSSSFTPLSFHLLIPLFFSFLIPLLFLYSSSSLLLPPPLFLLLLSSSSSREASLWCVHPLHGMGSSPWFPTLPE